MSCGRYPLYKESAVQKKREMDVSAREARMSTCRCFAVMYGRGHAVGSSNYQAFVERCKKHAESAGFNFGKLTITEVVQLVRLAEKQRCSATVGA